jgi:hypothetical protein
VGSGIGCRRRGEEKHAKCGDGFLEEVALERSQLTLGKACRPGDNRDKGREAI